MQFTHAVNVLMILNLGNRIVIYSKTELDRRPTRFTLIKIKILYDRRVAQMEAFSSACRFQITINIV